MNKKEEIQNENLNKAKDIKNIEMQKNENIKDVKELKKEKKQTEKDSDKTNLKNNRLKSKSRMLLVLSFIIIFAIISYVFLRGSYLEYKELGESYVQEFFTNLKFQYSIMAINFVVLYFIIYMTNRGIRKGLKEFFDKEKKPMPKLLNKSIALVGSALVSVFISKLLSQKLLLFVSNASFGKTDPIFGFDIGYYMFQKPFLETFILYLIGLMVGITIYMAIYYIISFNRFFDGIDREILKNSIFIKKLLRNVILIAIGIGLLTFINTQNVMFGNILTIENSETTRYNGAEGNIELTGANYTDSTIQRWGYTIFSILIVICIWKAVSYFKKQNTKNVIKVLAIIPGYLVILFIVMVGFDLIFTSSNKLDKEKNNIANNIENTKNAYNIDVEEVNLDNSGTITEEEVEKNKDVIDNIPLITSDIVLSNLKQNQTGTGYYSYNTASVAKYKIDGQDKLVYVSPREIVNSGRTYTSKTYEYTHGMGQIVTSATTTTEDGNIEYIQKEVSGEDDKLNTSQQRIYFGLETNEIIATNTKNTQEYDYTDEAGNEYTSKYEGEAGLDLNFIDRLILGITKGDLKLAFSGEMTDESKILINRNIIERAKKAMPYLWYDENPYTVVTDDGKIVWVLDAYTVSSSYPYSQYMKVQYDDKNEKINYIRNSVKVIVDAYDGTITYYITDETDPIAMAYNNMYPGLFKKDIPEDISEHFIYPEYLYKIQAELLKIYHNTKPDIIYRADDIWDFAKYNTSRITKTTGSILEPYYIMVNLNGKDEIGLMQIYTPNEKQNLISYLVGTTEGETNKLKLYKFSQDSNVVGPMQLEQQIEQDEAISANLESLNKTGIKVSKEMIVVPIQNTILYVEPIYQTMLNDPKNNLPQLKRVIVSSGNKVAIGNTLTEALGNLLSRYAVDIEVENTDDIEGLIEAIIKANNNLTESNESNNWEMIGTDIQKLQELINSLEKMKEEEDKEKEVEIENEKDNNTTVNELNDVNSMNVIENNTVEKNSLNDNSEIVTNNSMY